MKPDLILFDAGGTVIRPAKPVGETYAAMAAHYGRHWDPVVVQDGFRRAWKLLKERPVETIPSDGDDRAWWKEVVREAIRPCAGSESFPLEDYFEELYRAYARPALWRVYPETWHVLDALRTAGFSLGILSNWDNRLEELLEGLELGEYFPRRWISAQCGASKPHPEIYRRVLCDTGLAPEKILIVGDDVTNDVTVPRAAGWQAVHVHRPEQDLRRLLEFVGLPEQG